MKKRPAKRRPIKPVKVDISNSPASALTRLFRSSISNLGSMSWLYSYNPIEHKFVYVFYNSSTGLYKIGISYWPEGRLINIASASGCKIHLVACVKVNKLHYGKEKIFEKLLHIFFKPKRKSGEWFDLDLRSILSIRHLFYNIDGELIKDKVNEHFEAKRECSMV